MHRKILCARRSHHARREPRQQLSAVRAVVDSLERRKSRCRPDAKPVLDELDMPYEPRHQATRRRKPTTEASLDVHHMGADKARD
eukprot:6290884-Heterocapsa_arctica.AAC.1